MTSCPDTIPANHDEGTAFGTKNINTTAQFLTSLLSAGVANETAQNFLALYPDIPAIGIPGTFIGRPGGLIGSMAKRSFAYMGDNQVHAQRRLTNQAWKAANVTSYSYEWNVLVNGQTNLVGATHAQEVAFVFHNLEGDGYPSNGNPNPFEGKPRSYKELATLMSRAWIGFIANGDPNSLNCESCSSQRGALLNWPTDADCRYKGSVAKV